MEVVNLIGLESLGDGAAEAVGEGVERRRNGELCSSVCGGVNGRSRESVQPVQRRLLVKSGDLSPLNLSPKRSSGLLSLGDDSAILDAIFGNILQTDRSTVNETEGDIESPSIPTESVPLPSAPPMESDWDIPGPSGYRIASNRPSSALDRRRLSTASSSTYSSTLSLSKLDLLVDPADNTSQVEPDVLTRGTVRSTVIGGLPLQRRSCLCSGQAFTEVSCSNDGSGSCNRISSSLRRPRSASASRGRTSPTLDLETSQTSAHQNYEHNPSEIRSVLNKRIGAATTVVESSSSTALVVPSAPRQLQMTPRSNRTPTVRQTPQNRPRPDRTRSAVTSPSISIRSTSTTASPQTTVSPPQRESVMEEEGLSPLGQWPHSYSNTFACLACTLGIFNISRFAILSVQYGANFVVQFFVMSVVMGIPLFTFHVSLGQLLGSGTMDMWKISPIFQGIGVALLLSQALLGIYSIVGVSWMLVYFRDSFITKHDTYRWAEPFLGYMGGSNWRFNSSFKLEETVADYFSGIVLQRHHVENPTNSPGTLKFQLTFNLAVVWMIVFIALSKGLKSYGKVVYFFSSVPIIGMVFLCVKIMGLAPSYRKSGISLPQTDWSEFFLNSKSWSVAMTEAFHTWGLLGASAMQMASHNRRNHFLHKDTNIVTAVTFGVLILSAFLANTCSQLLLAHGYSYTPSSFERASTYGFLQHDRPWPYRGSTESPVRWMQHHLYLAGERVVKPGTNTRQESGYQALRLATELLPATLAVLGAEKLSPFWSVMFYFIFILFGIAQQLAIMHSVITGIIAIKLKTMKSWETTITFFACVCGFILGLPLATELGIFVVYFMDYCIGGGWWLVLLYLVELMAVFMVRGRPYSGETVVAELFKKAGPALQNLAAPMLSFMWNVILPVILMVQTVSVFKSGNYRDLFKWSSPMNYDYWPSWSRTFGSLLQIIPLLTIPFIAFIQSCRYLSDGPPDIFDRMQLLYRPPEEVLEARSTDRDSNGSNPPELEDLPESVPPTDNPPEDPPPKYTPPPSYSTATGARIAKLLRQSFRRSFRRIMEGGANSSGASNSRETNSARPPPPDYATVLVEINHPPPPPQVEIRETSHPVVGAHQNVQPDVVLQTATLPPFTQMSTLVRNSFRRAMQDSIAQSTSSERLVDNEAPTNSDLIIINPNQNDKTGRNA